VNKCILDPLNLEIPIEYDIKEAKLPTLTQATIYKGILEWKHLVPQNTTKKTETHLPSHKESDRGIGDQYHNMAKHAKENHQTNYPAIPLQDNAWNLVDQVILEEHKDRETCVTLNCPDRPRRNNQQ